MAYYEPQQNKIIGAKEGTLFYRHEQGHQKSWKIGVEPQIQMYSWLVIICAVAWVGWNQKDLFFKIIFTLPLLGLLYSELYAWYYAFIGYKFEIKNEK